MYPRSFFPADICSGEPFNGVFSILAGLAANKGGPYRYSLPFCIIR